ncbi:MAG: hypothetical protein ABR555_02240 [Pyrinomonadaceae bacterium]
MFPPQEKPGSEPFGQILIEKEREIWEVRSVRVCGAEKMPPEGAFIIEDDDGQVVTKEDSSLLFQIGTLICRLGCKPSL